jgi:hypothetical protein
MFDVHALAPVPEREGFSSKGTDDDLLERKPNNDLGETLLRKHSKDDDTPKSTSVIIR